MTVHMIAAVAARCDQLADLQQEHGPLAAGTGMVNI
jgi:hypothetical protein